MSKLRVPVYLPLQENLSRFPTSMALMSKVTAENTKFDMEFQNHVINEAVQRIRQLIKQRMDTLEQQTSSLESMVQIKMYSFHHYLRTIDFKGFAKWCVINQSFQEVHPQGLSLLDIVE
mmetsp:Transcript_4439/g.7562  ORF Transcript_4439/g.7562 Transcript_4439/m.7562 type:complete len:119 (-) Transcript_4439:1096-1452(-)